MLRRVFVTVAAWAWLASAAAAARDETTRAAVHSAGCVSDSGPAFSR
jgi:hypothetical protein